MTTSSTKDFSDRLLDLRPSSSFGDKVDEPDPIKTFSDDEEDDNDDSQSMNDNDDDDDEEDDSSKVPFWKQHLVAIVIALIASIAGHLYNQSRTPASSFYNTFLPPLENSLEPHDHLDGFRRTANISFCLKETMPPMATGRLKLMDFYISKEHFPTLQYMYLADQEGTMDTYQNALNNNHGGEWIDDLNIEDSQYQCLLDQYHNKPQNIKLKGHTYYFTDPTMEDIYPELAAASSIGSLNGGGVAKTKVLAVSSRERKRKLQQPPLTFTGFAAKFVNLSSKTVLLFWDGKGGHDSSKRLVAEIAPFESVGTATTPGQSFHVTPLYDAATALQRWVVTADTALIFYEPMTPNEMKRHLLEEENDPKTYAMYQRQVLNQAFARDYTVASKRTWLANFPRQFPMHYMHPAQYIGQEHVIGDWTLKVASVTPRVFIIDNFLTPQECHEIIRLGVDKGLKPSTLHASATARETNDTATRSSSNTWLARDTSYLTEDIYQRAAKLTNIDEDLFQKFHETSAQHHSIAESLQIVRYRKGEEYTPHHDFVSPSINNRFQGTRFATLLIYLNTVEEGGETRFPRAVNNYNAAGLEISPNAGTALLFYNMLEDGNVDDLSQHGSNKILGNANKWVANLWIWDPVIG
ncbi:2-oxyglutarate/Fe(II) oxygenase [Nitzschia inconspicua]|uniref:2-oxyglutarate/Fe(II) oxygenase n=1 Tax=Nitzschia inconspicua TaxID=303405 RepID=A0A9K3LR17_9STRA|nr:2-oxyglutarate/Fe(II) oxygenase [Nitzschia inconspicua]